MSSGIFLACTPATADQSGGWGRRRYFLNPRDSNVPLQHFDLTSRNLLNYLCSSKLTTLQYRPLMWRESAVPNALNSVESAFKLQLELCSLTLTLFAVDLWNRSQWYTENLHHVSCMTTQSHSEKNIPNSIWDHILQLMYCIWNHSLMKITFEHFWNKRTNFLMVKLN